ncbi:hypothetical protein P4S63_06040 [Pseudoalteromonas sp. B193]
MKLIYVDDNLPGITRKLKHKSWLYFDPIGKQIKEQNVIDRLNGLAFPPAYKNAWFCPEENGHILATGFDSKGESNTVTILNLGRNKKQKIPSMWSIW